MRRSNLAVVPRMTYSIARFKDAARWDAEKD
jgi:hypothetical protein